MPIESKVVEIILTIGLSVIGYFLKLIHSDLRELINRVHSQDTRLTVGESRIQSLEGRVDKLEEAHV